MRAQSWRVRAVRSALMALTPAAVRSWRQRRRGGSYSSPGSDAAAISHGLRMITALRESGARISGMSAIEIGTGWHPLIPLLLRIAGASPIYLTDVRPLASDVTIVEATHKIRAAVLADPSILDRLERTRTEVMARLDSWRSGMTYLAPFDARELARLGPVDLVFSRAVLEQMPASFLRDTITASAQALRLGGYSAHIVDNSDYYSHTDPSISRLFFLTQTPLAYRISRLNPLERLNRLRHSDYLRMFDRAGFTLCRDVSRVDDRTYFDVPNLLPRLQPEFSAYTRHDLATLETFVVHRKTVTR